MRSAVAQDSGAHETGSGGGGGEGVVSDCRERCARRVLLAGRGSCAARRCGSGACLVLRQERALRAVRQRETSDYWSGTGNACVLWLYTIDTIEAAVRRNNVGTLWQRARTLLDCTTARSRLAIARGSGRSGPLEAGVTARCKIASRKQGRGPDQAQRRAGPIRELKCEASVERRRLED